MKTAEEILSSLPLFNNGAGGHYRTQALSAMEEYASQFKPTPSSTGELEREAEEKYPIDESLNKCGTLLSYVSHVHVKKIERSAYIKGRQAPSQKGLEELIEWMKKENWLGYEADEAVEEIITKATELLIQSK